MQLISAWLDLDTIWRSLCPYVALLGLDSRAKLLEGCHSASVLRPCLSSGDEARTSWHPISMLLLGWSLTAEI